jgi:hypothetical protein
MRPPARLGTAAGAAALACAVVAAGAHAESAAHVSRCTHATVAGKHVCLAQGQACKPRYQTTYHRYKFQCTSRNRKGYFLTPYSSSKYTF